jgi:hypothetical protein
MNQSTTSTQCPEVKLMIDILTFSCEMGSLKLVWDSRTCRFKKYYLKILAGRTSRTMENNMQNCTRHKKTSLESKLLRGI